MKRRITMIKLKDGKQLFYPSKSELERLWTDVVELTHEETLTKDELNKSYIEWEIN